MISREMLNPVYSLGKGYILGIFVAYLLRRDWKQIDTMCFFITKSKELDKEEIVAEVKKTSKPTSLDDLTPEQKAALRKMVIEEARKKYEAEEKKESE